MKPNRDATAVFAAQVLLIFAFSGQHYSQDPAPNRRFYGIPAGTEITVKMDNEINSRSSRVDDTFTVTVSEPVEVDGAVVLPTGSVIEGRVTSVRKAAAGRKDGSLGIIFETLILGNDKSRPIEGVIEREDEEPETHAADILTVIGGTAAGTVLGTTLGSKSGTLLGSAVGGGAGIGMVLLKKGSEFRIRADEEFRVRLTRSVELPAIGY